MWRRVSIPVQLTDKQKDAVAQRMSGRGGILFLGDLRPHLRGVETPELGYIRHRRPAPVTPRPHQVRLIRRDSGYAVEYTARSLGSLVTPLRLILTVMAVLSGGVLISALTTSDRMWWAEAFSKLGVSDDLSSFAFNGGLVAAGVVACVFAARLRLDLARLRFRGFSKTAVAAVPALVCLAGAGIATVGVFTETANRFMHDLGALVLAGAFAALVLSGPWFLRRLSRRLHAVTAVCSAGLFIATGLYIPGALTLAAYELVLFALFFLWLAVLSHYVHAKLNRRRAKKNAAR